MVEEGEVGILCHANSASGFRGILKQRYADFIVNEVDCEDNVVHLTCLDAPEEALEEPDEAIEDQGLKPLDVEKHIEAFKAIAREGDAELLRGLLIKVLAGENDECAPIVLAPDSDKSHRTEVHNFFKDTLPFLVTDTVDGPDSWSKCVRIRVLTNNSNEGRKNGKRTRDSRGKLEQNKRQKHVGFDSRGAESWPKHQGKFLQFHLYKENKDTQDALGVVGKMLGMQPKSFGIAGTKDKRAVTTQRVTAFKVAASKLAALNKKLYGIKVGNFCYVDRGLVLGQLSGNRFTVTLRGVVADSEGTINEAANALGKSGFINYFGLQRFGTSSVPTYTVGAALLRGEWEAAVNLIMKPRDGEREDIKEAREYFLKTKDADGTMLRMPRQFFIERAVLAGLRKHPGNFLQAINTIPRTMRMMYIHSYQSFLWNHAASRRIQLYGVDKVIEGDLVVCKETGDEKTINVKEASMEDDNNSDSKIGDENAEIVEETDILFEVKHATADDVAGGLYNINDVVLPLPGSKVVLPANDISLVYEDLAKKDQLDLQKCSHNVKEFSLLHLSGGYRRLIQTPSDFEWKILKYNDRTKSLAETDWEKIKKNTKNQAMVEETALPKEEPDVSNLSDQTALQLKFTLPSSCYATMAIRELLKGSSSVAYHKTLNEEA